MPRKSQSPRSRPRPPDKERTGRPRKAAGRQRTSDADERETRLDEAVELTFPGSDPAASGRATGTEPPSRPAGRQAPVITKDDIDRASGGAGETRSMSALSLTPGYLESLMAQIRGLQAQEIGAEVETDANAVEDGMAEGPQEEQDDLSREELRESFRDRVGALDERQQAELVALLWLGRGDVEVDEWEDAVRMAQERRETPTADYLLGQPLVAEQWAEGAAQLGVELLPERAFD